MIKLLWHVSGGGGSSKLSFGRKTLKKNNFAFPIKSNVPTDTEEPNQKESNLKVSFLLARRIKKTPLGHGKRFNTQGSVRLCT